VPEVFAAPHDERFVPDRFRYAHHADFVRLDALIEHGGVYADIDTIFVHPFPDELFDAPFVIGRELPVRDEHTGEVRPSTCNALMMAEPGSAFARAWRDGMADAMNGTWSNHSGFLALELAEAMPDEVRLEPQRSFGRYGANPEGIALLFDRLDTDWDGVLSLHLWSHLWWEATRQDFSPFHGGLLDEAYIRTGATTYAALARPFLPDLEPW
jgi:hypothetical protein